MAGGGLLALLDDITTILDDVASMSKLAAKKTSGIVGDDLAVNAHGLSGIDPSREIPIINKVRSGSLKNKAWLIPVALALPSAVITPLLMFGGAFLCYEALEKVLHKKDKKDEKHHQDMLVAINISAEELEKLEDKKIKEAIKTDTILSAEIIAVTLGTIAAAPLLTKALVLSVVGLGMTYGVYGLVTGIVRMDDVGLKLSATEGDSTAAKIKRTLGKSLINAAPAIMKGLAIVGTAAMFTVGGGILMHGLGIGHALHGLVGLAAEAAVGVAAGFGSIGIVKVAAKPFEQLKKAVSPFIKKVMEKNPFSKKKTAQPENAPTPSANEDMSENNLGKTSLGPQANAALDRKSKSPAPGATQNPSAPSPL